MLPSSEWTFLKPTHHDGLITVNLNRGTKSGRVDPIDLTPQQAHRLARDLLIAAGWATDDWRR